MCGGKPFTAQKKRRVATGGKEDGVFAQADLSVGKETVDEGSEGGKVSFLRGEGKEMRDVRRDRFRVDHSFLIAFIQKSDLFPRKGVKEAILDYEVQDGIEHPEEGRLSLIRISLLTGRTHQIRVQFSSRGTPLLGDRKYGAPSHGVIGLFSHAITFPHPNTGKRMTFSANPHGGAWELF